MATIKSFTSVEQSRKLAEILPLESADMYYAGHRSIINPKEWEYGDTPKIRGKYISFDDKRIFYPCWSLAALLELLPKRLEIEDNVYELSVYFYGLYYWNIINGNPCFESKDKDNLVDACVAMIEKLYELNLL